MHITSDDIMIGHPRTREVKQSGHYLPDEGNDGCINLDLEESLVIESPAMPRRGEPRLLEILGKRIRYNITKIPFTDLAYNAHSVTFEQPKSVHYVPSL